MFFPSISLPIFAAGKLQAELDVSKVRKNISVVRYENAIQTGFREVSDALVAVTTYDEQMLAQKANLEINEEYYMYAKKRY